MDIQQLLQDLQDQGIITDLQNTEFSYRFVHEGVSFKSDRKETIVSTAIDGVKRKVLKLEGKPSHNFYLTMDGEIIHIPFNSRMPSNIVDRQNWG